VRLRENDSDLGLTIGDEGNPAESVGGDFVADREAERVAVKEECGVGIVDENVYGAEGNGHGTSLR
jgi:hypothetical protein